MTFSNPSRQGRIADVNADSIAEAAKILAGGGIVAVPTETVYGLAADASNADAVAQIYQAKGRPSFNPLIVHVVDQVAANRLAVFDSIASRLAEAFWPGPLTLVLPLRDDANIAPAVTAGLSTIALRVSSHRVMKTLLAQSGGALAAPSANRSGSISPTLPQHVRASLGDDAPMILDGGPCANGLESTIVAVRPNGWQMLRPGPITAGQITSLLGTSAILLTDTSIEAPGQLAQHYAPSKPVLLNVSDRVVDAYWIGFGDIAGDDNLSASGDLALAASQLFAALHRGDASDFARIAIAPIPVVGIGLAINDRLQRAAA
jgi:L-threonylcarbamoyladenylate synthase